MLNTIADRAISNEVWYTEEMAKSLVDKLFFLDKVDARMFVDFGCADGTMLAFIDHVFPKGMTLVGYDINPKMIEAAKKAHPDSAITFTSDWEEVRALVSEHRERAPRGDGRVCLVLSSVLHELHSYADEQAIADAFAKIWGEDGSGLEFDYVAIRDMMVSRATSRPSDMIAVARVQQVFEARHPGLLAQWEAKWGAIIENWSLVHFLLTYRYTANWEREFRENYLPKATEEFLAGIPEKFFPIFKEQFTLPFLRRRVKEDFGIALSDTTHIKLVLELTR
jgi:SAM-dependent methyltransferase